MGQKHVIELLDFYGWWLLERRAYCVVWASLNSLLFCLKLPVLEWQVCPTMSSVSELGWGSDHVLGLASHALSDEPMVSQETLALESTCWKRLEQISIVPSWPPEDSDYAVQVITALHQSLASYFSKEWCVDLHTFLHGAKVKISLSTNQEFRASPGSPSPSSIIAVAKYSGIWMLTALPIITVENVATPTVSAKEFAGQIIPWP